MALVSITKLDIFECHAEHDIDKVFQNKKLQVNPCLHGFRLSLTWFRI